MDYLDQETSNSMPEETIVQTYLTTVDLTGSKGLASVRLEIFRKQDWWKSGWYFEGMVLEPETPSSPEIQKVSPKKEEQEYSH